MCWIIPLIVGVISAILGYLMGRTPCNAKLALLNEEKEAFKRKLETCELHKAQLMNDAGISDISEIGITANAESAVAEVERVTGTEELTENETPVQPFQAFSVTVDDIEEHEHYQALLAQYTQAQKELAQYAANSDIQTAEISESDIENHEYYQALLEKNTQLEEAIASLEATPVDLSESDIENHEHYQTLLEKSTELEKQLEETLSVLENLPMDISEHDVENHAHYQALLEKYIKSQEAIAASIIPNEKDFDYRDIDVREHPDYQVLMAKHQNALGKLEEQQIKTEEYAQLEAQLRELPENTNISEADIENHSHYQALLEKYLQAQEALALSIVSTDEAEEDKEEEPIDISEHPDYQNLLVEHESAIERLEKQQYEMEKVMALAETEVKAHPIYRSLLNKYRESKLKWEQQNQPIASLSATYQFDAKTVQDIMGRKVKENDLTIIEGIGPKISSLFNINRINTWQDLADISVDRCREILDDGGKRFAIHDPSTWSKQAQLAAEGKWQELADWQKQLKGGREV